MIITDIQDHIELIRSLSKLGRPLHLDAPTATIKNPDWFYPNGDSRVGRQNLHMRLIDKQSSNADFSRKAILLAGPSGAGKSTVVNQILRTESENYLTIDADVFKIGLLEDALADGSYERFIKPAQIKELEAEG